MTNFKRVSKEALDFQLVTLFPVHVKDDPFRTNLIFLNHDRNYSSFLTIQYLVEHERVADIFTLSRSMFESIISMGLLAKQLVQDDVKRYQEYQYIEIYRTYSHLKRLGFENLSGLSEEEAKDIENRRLAYIQTWGKSELSWTGKSLEGNVKLVDASFPPACNETHFYEYLYCQVYRKGSTASHSSFSGLSRGVKVETIVSKGVTANRFIVNESNLIYSCFHALIVFLSSVRFLGFITKKTECEDYFQKITSYIISEN